MKRTFAFHLLVLIVAIFLGGCSRAEIQEFLRSEVPEGVLFQDDFSNASSGWNRFTDENQSVEYYSDAYRMVVNVPQRDVIATPGLEFSDTIINVDSQILNGPENNDYGIVCRYRDESNFYFFIISSDGYYGIGAVNNGAQILLGMESLLTTDVIHQGEETNHITAICNGSNLSLSVNGFLLYQTTDSSLTEGEAGLIAGTFDEGGVDVVFDNFVVSTP